MSMRTIALTGANEPAMQSVAEQLLESAAAGGFQLSVLIGIKDANEATAVCHSHGELWRVGDDDSKPELDALVDRAIDDSAPGRTAIEAAQALRRFMTKADVQDVRAAVSNLKARGEVFTPTHRGAA